MRETIKKIVVITVVLTACVCALMVTSHKVMHYVVANSADKIGAPDPDSPRPIDVRDTVFIEEMTWMEIRDALKAGKKTILVCTGGVEQCGPYLATGKHNYIMRATSEAIARKLGDALVAPIIPFVPEGDLDPPTEHMRYPGTLSLTEPAYRAMLTDICTCFKTHGFAHIVLLGDSYWNLEGMNAVAEALNAKWAKSNTRVYSIPQYYNYHDVTRWLEQQGIRQRPEWLHDDFAVSSMLAATNPTLIRMEERRAAGKFHINGIDLDPIENTVAWGRKLIEFRADVAVQAIRKAMAK